MTTVAVEELPEKLLEVLDKAQRGEEFTITRNNIAVVRISPVSAANEPERKPRVPGSAKHLLVYMAPDFEATPEGFEEYM